MDKAADAAETDAAFDKMYRAVSVILAQDKRIWWLLKESATRMDDGSVIARAARHEIVDCGTAACRVHAAQKATAALGSAMVAALVNQDHSLLRIQKSTLQMLRKRTQGKSAGRVMAILDAADAELHSLIGSDDDAIANMQVLATIIIITIIYY